MLGLLRYLRSVPRRHPRIGTAVTIVAILVSVGAGGYAIAHHHYRAAEAALDRWHFDEARAHLAWCMRLLPRSPKILLLAARVERMRGDFAQAEAFLNEAGELQGGATEASQIEWVLLRCQLGEMDAVAPSLNYSVSQGCPDSGAILETMSRVYFQESRLIESLVCLDRWVAMEPTSARAFDVRSGVYLVLGKSPEAIADCERALELEPDRSWVRLRLIHLYLREVNPEAARPHLEYLQATQADDAKTQNVLARYLSLVGKADEARALFDRAYAGDPNDEAALLARAKLELQMGDAAAVETWGKRVLKQNAYSPEAHFLLYRSMQLQGRSSEAARFKKDHERLEAASQKLGKLLTSSPRQLAQDPALGTELGRVFLELGHATAGQVALFKVLERDRGYRPAHEALAAYYERTGAADKAKRHRDALASTAAP